MSAHKPSVPKRLLLTLALVLAAIPIATRAQTANAAPTDWEKAAGGKQEFDVASVKLNKTGIINFHPETYPRSNVNLGPGKLYIPAGGLFTATNQLLINYIAFAYKMSGSQQLAFRAHAPKWVLTERYDLHARSTDPRPTKDQLRLMMQSMLADRFKLIVHQETQQLPVLAMVQAKPGKLGPQIRPHRPDDPVCATDQGMPMLTSKYGPAPTSRLESLSDGFPAVCGWIAYIQNGGGNGGYPSVTPSGRGVTMALIASTLPSIEDPGLDRPVIDRTGLTGTYDFTLSIPFVPGSITDTDQSDSSPMFIESLRDQLGLKLERQTGPVEVLVIDHIEHPSDN